MKIWLLKGNREKNQAVSGGTKSVFFFIIKDKKLYYFNHNYIKIYETLLNNILECEKSLIIEL